MLWQLHQAPTSNQNPHHCSCTTVSSRWKSHCCQQGLWRHGKGLGVIDHHWQGGWQRLV